MSVVVLSFTTINLAYDESDQILVDPLVKRVEGFRGEQHVKVDDVLYARAASDLYKKLEIPLKSKFPESEFFIWFYF